MPIPFDPKAQSRRSESQWRKVYSIGAFCTLFVILFTLADLILGSLLGGNLSELPLTASERFMQFNNNPLLGLYNLDMLNLITTFLMVPAFFALYGTFRHRNKAFSLLALVIVIIGSTVFIANNVALPMLELSHKYASSVSEAQRTGLMAAGEALLARGSHGSYGAFPGFFIILLADLMISWIMLTGRVYNRLTGLTGLLGSSLLILYILLVTFAPYLKQQTVILAAPGGILSLLWMLLFMIRLFKLSVERNK